MSLETLKVGENMQYYATHDEPLVIMHYGRKGMKWYKNIYTKDEKRTTKTLKRHLSADKKNLKTRGALASESAGEYNSAEANYKKELRRPSLSRTKKQERIDQASNELSKAGTKYEKTRGDFLRADRIYESDAKKYKEHVNNLVNKYGSENVKSIKTKTYQLGDAYVKDMITTGVTLYDLPLIGTYLSGRYIGDREAADRRANIDEAASKRY